jgi:phage tail protein X
VGVRAVYLSKEGDVVDAVAFKHYGRSWGTTEAVLRVNPGLAAFGVRLPAGLRIELPAVPPPETETIRRIWG